MTVRVGADISYIGIKDKGLDFRMSLDIPRVGTMVNR